MSTVQQGFETPSLKAAVWPFVVVIVTQMLFAGFSVTTLTAIRSWIVVVDSWARNEQTAASDLMIYANTGDVHAFESFQQAFKIPLAYLDVTADGTKSELGSLRSRSALIKAGNSPDDSRAMGLSLRYLGKLSYMRDGLSLARKASDLTVRLDRLAEQVHDALTRRTRTPRSPWCRRSRPSMQGSLRCSMGRSRCSVPLPARSRAS